MNPSLTSQSHGIIPREKFSNPSWAFKILNDFINNDYSIKLPSSLISISGGYWFSTYRNRIVSEYNSFLVKIGIVNQKNIFYIRNIQEQLQENRTKYFLNSASFFSRNQNLSTFLFTPKQKWIDLILFLPQIWTQSIWSVWHTVTKSFPEIVFEW